MYSTEVNSSQTRPTHKLVYLVRHGQAFHNIKYKNHAMPDPLLTPKGIRQCEELASSFPAAAADAIELIVTSPLRRAIYTAICGFPNSLGRGIKLIALPEAQEIGQGVKPCDTGSNPDVLRAEFAEHNLDLSLVLDGWNPVFDQAADQATLRDRASFVRRWLRDRDEDVICLVSHGGFLHYLTGDYEGLQDRRGTGWGNCEWRMYHFKAPIDEDDENASLIEIKNHCQTEAQSFGLATMKQTFNSFDVAVSTTRLGAFA